MALDEVIDGSETDHRPTHDDLAKCANGLERSGPHPPGSMLFVRAGIELPLAETVSGQQLVKVAHLALGTSSADRVMSADRKFVYVPEQYRDFEINGNLTVFNSTKRILWHENTTVLALVLWLDTINAGGNTILDVVKQGGVSVLDAGKITFDGSTQSLTVVPASPAVVAGDRWQFKCTALGTTPGANLSGTIVHRPNLRQT